MKKILIITAHPSNEGFTHKIAKASKDSSILKGDEVEILDLYQTELKQDFLAFVQVKNFPKTENTLKIQEKINYADELIFISPIWWGDAPAIMKNFFDTSFSAGFGFKYEDGKPIKLLKGKTAKVFFTCDGPGFFYRFPFVSLKTNWKIARLGFCGIKVTHFEIFDKMKNRDEKNRIKILEKISKLN